MYHSITTIALLLSTAFASPVPDSATDPSPWPANPIGIPQGVVNASFTVYSGCGASVSCGPSFAAQGGPRGYAALNILQWATGDPALGSVTACGACWHIQPQSNVNPNPGAALGKPIVVKINNECTDGGYCDQNPSRPLSTQYQTQLHFDLCSDTDTWTPFAGQVPPGQLLGVATYNPNCDGWDDGQYGSSLGNFA